ncbi:class I tRNA ligase family protein, partial [Patescibacteria group bacterium]|nr:class I tRNA ligase family protein [Patescibacteria group bacterium]
ADKKDRNVCLSVMYEVLVTLTKVAAPMIPFVAEEIFKNLVQEESVHLQSFPKADKGLVDAELIKDMQMVRKIVELGHAKRKKAGIKLRQPLMSLVYKVPVKLDVELEEILADELNVKKVEYGKSPVEPKVVLDTNITQLLKEEGEARDLIRQIQQLRKKQGLILTDKTKILAPNWPKAFEKLIIESTASVSLEKSPELKVLKV